MADFKTLVNNALVALNEVKITTIGSNTGVQEHAEDSILKAVLDINNEEKEWPYLISEQTKTVTPGIQRYALPTTYRSIDWESFFIRPSQLLSNSAFTSDITTNWTAQHTGTGSAAYTSTGNGRARLAGGSSGIGALEQSVSTIANIEYKIILRTFTNTVKIRVGTSSGATDILSDSSKAITNAGGGAFHEQNFTATTGTTFIRIQNDANNNADVDLITVHENISGRDLTYIDLDEWKRWFRTNEELLIPSSLLYPERVFRTHSDEFGLSGVPDKPYDVLYDAWVDPTVMSANTNSPSIPAEWHTLIEERALMYMYRFRSHLDEARAAESNYNKGIKNMRAKLIEYPKSMSDNRVPNQGRVTSSNVRTRSN